MSAAYFRTLTVDHTKVPSTQSDFPVLLSVTDPTFKTIANGGHVDNGYDIGFYADSAGTTKLKWELESYDATTGAIVAHVKIPSVSSSANTVFYLLYGDSAVTTDQSDAAGVWSNGYVGVWHLGDGTAVNTSDSLGLHAGTIGGPVAPVTGQIRGGAWFQSPSYMAFGDIGLHNPPLSIEAWIAPYNGVYASLLNTGSWDGHYMSHDPSGLTHGLVTVTGGFAAYAVASQTSAGAMVWQHITGVWTSNSSRQVYVNGVSGAVETTTIVPGLTPNGFVLGADWAYTNNFYGYLDEVRVSNVARSADWIATCYNAQSAPGTFLTLGAETSGALPVSVLLTGVAAAPQIGTGTVAIGVVVTPPVEELVPGRNWYWPQEETVYLTGVVASPAIGTITAYDSSQVYKLFPFPRQQIVPEPIPRIAPRRKAPFKVENPVPQPVVVRLTGVQSSPVTGTGAVTIVFDFLDEEIVALLEAA